MNYIDSGTSGIVKFLAYAVLIMLAAYCADRVYNKKYNDCVSSLVEIMRSELSNAKSTCSTMVK